MKQVAWIIGALILVAGAAAAGYYFLPKTEPAPVVDVTDTPVLEEETVPVTSAPPSDPATASFKWVFSNMSGGTEEVPRIQVSLDYEKETKIFGTVDGPCEQLYRTSRQPLEGEIDGVICYHDGKGTEFGVFREGDVVVAKQGIIEEPNADGGNTRGNFKVLFAL